VGSDADSATPYGRGLQAASQKGMLPIACMCARLWTNTWHASCVTAAPPSPTRTQNRA
jgi:hypothetical protein